MTMAQPLWTDNPVAANVRAELARHGLNANRLPDLLGGTQAYWSRRTRGAVAFDTNDLVGLAHLMHIDPGVFFAGAVDKWRARRDSNPQPSVWWSEGSELEDDGVVVDLMDRLSVDQPASSDQLADVLVLRRAES